MKSHFSTTNYLDDQFNFHIINNAETVIHLTASPALHRKAIDTLMRIVPGCSVTALSEQRALTNLIKDLIYNPGKPRQTADFENNPFLANGTPFQKKVWHHIMNIGFGKTLTYSALAKKAGIPKGARAIGNACNANPLALIIPCHRVVGVNGPGGYAGGSEFKVKLLEIERRGTKE